MDTSNENSQLSQDLAQPAVGGGGLSQLSTEVLLQQMREHLERFKVLAEKVDAQGEEPTAAQTAAIAAELDWLQRAKEELEGRGLIEREPEPTVAAAREPWRWPTWQSLRSLMRGLMALGVVVLGIAGVYVVYERLQPRPPVFRRSEQPSLPELMAQPPTYNYGSSIHFWTYHQADGRLAEVAVTGHADSQTCKKISGLLFNTYLEKHLEAEDMIVAGSSWFKLREDPRQRVELERDPRVAEYRQVREAYNLGRRALEIASLIPLESKGKDRSSVQEIEASLKQLAEQKAALEKEPTVASYLRNSKSGEALDVLIKEAQRIAGTSGLVYFHRLPHDLAESVRQRIAAAVKAQQPTVLTFDDLLAKGESREAVVLTEVRKLGSGEPIALSIPMAEFLVDSFEEAKRQSHSAIERAMIGDAKEREAFYQRKERSFQEQLERCRRLPPSLQEKEISLNETCNSDAICEPSKKPERMRYKEYCDLRIPYNIKLVKQWSEHIQPLLSSIKQDAAKKEGGKIDALDLAVLGESMLRNWALPIGENQSAFDSWRETYRTPIWRALLKQLTAQGVRDEILGGENMIFNVRREGANLVVRPMHIIDLSRSVVVVDPRLGGTRIVNAWAQRSVVSELASGKSPPSVDAILDGLRKGGQGKGAPSGSDALRTLLSIEPTEGVKRLEGMWRGFFPDDQKHLESLAAKNQAALSASELFSVVQEIRDSPAAKEQPLAQERRLRELLKSYPNAPADYHLLLARDLAQAILMAEPDSEGARGEVSDAEVWNVVQTYTNAAALDKASRLFERWKSAENQGKDDGVDERVKALLTTLGRNEVFGVDDPYRRGRVVISAYLSEDAAVVIRESVAEAMKRDPQYVAAANRQKQLPKEGSMGLKALFDSTRVTHSEAELEAFQVVRMRELLRHRSLAELAAGKLWGTALPDYSQVLALLRPVVSGGAINAALELSGPVKRLEDRLASQHTPDTLTRSELAGNLMYGGERLLVRARHLLHEYPELLSLWRDHRFIAARIYFEDGDYQKALEILFSEKIPLALYAPQLRFTVLAAQQEGLLEGVRIERSGGQLTVGVQKGGAFSGVLRIEGLPAEATEALHKHLAESLSHHAGVRGPIAERVLGLSVPLGAEAKAFRQVILDPAARLLVLKAMVYGCVPPASNLISSEGRCGDSALGSRKRDLIAQGRSVSISVPELTEVKAAAERGIKH